MAVKPNPSKCCQWYSDTVRTVFQDLSALAPQLANRPVHEVEHLLKTHIRERLRIAVESVRKTEMEVLPALVDCHEIDAVERFLQKRKPAWAEEAVSVFYSVCMAATELPLSQDAAQKLLDFRSEDVDATIEILTWYRARWLRMPAARKYFFSVPCLGLSAKEVAANAKVTEAVVWQEIHTLVSRFVNS